jgi:hypothetical protein
MGAYRAFEHGRDPQSGLASVSPATWEERNMSATAAPGWYPHGNVLEHWDGREWTGETQPLTISTATVTAAPVTEDGGSGLAIAGYVLAVLMPLVGFILGIVAITRPPGHGSKKHGVAIVVVSVVAFVVYLALIIHAADQAAQQSLTTSGY